MTTCLEIKQVFPLPAMTKFQEPAFHSLERNLTKYRGLGGRYKCRTLSPSLIHIKESYKREAARRSIDWYFLYMISGVYSSDALLIK